MRNEPARPQILIIDDDRELCALLCDFLQLQGFDAGAVHDGAVALTHCRRHSYDAIVLDIMLPGLQGLDVLQRLRQFCTTPVLMLTARGEDTDRIVGLEMGADDYLAKPCNPRELAARLRAILRRQHGGTDRPGTRLQAGQTGIDPARRRASHAGADLPLTSAEFNVLRVLLEHAGQVVDKETLSQRALGRPLAAYDRSVDVHISKIRKKLSALGAGELILSVRGVGYQFIVDQSPPERTAH
ncbi:MAG: response regulator transcription factor [Halioglobus sp.]|nr:response regulator transcription factor [Halioglobus sp.]